MREQPVGANRANARLNDAERVALKDRDGNDVNMVVLAVLAANGRDYALVTREQDLEDPSYWVFEYRTDDAGKADLAVVQDDETYDELYHLFNDLVEVDEA